MSSKSDQVAVSIKILDREYRIACPEEEQKALLESADHLDKRMREIRDSGRVVGLDRISVMAALNIANDLLACQRKDRDVDDKFGKRISALRSKLDAALEDLEA